MLPFANTYFRGFEYYYKQKKLLENAWKGVNKLKSLYDYRLLTLLPQREYVKFMLKEK